MIVVLIVAAGAAWEPQALGVLGEDPDIVVLKRCVDVDDLLAAAASGQAEVAVVGLDAPGLDVGAIDHLRRQGVRPVAVVPADRVDAARARARLLGVTSVVLDDALEALPDAVAAPEAPPTPAPGDLGAGELDGLTVDPTALARRGGSPARPGAGDVPLAGAGRVLVVWGPSGAPGRSTLAAAVAAEVARRRRRTILVDADPYGGSLAQQLGILDEVSGLLAAARLAHTGHLAERFATVQRALDPALSVVTGLPRPDRWAEVRPGAIEQLLEIARGHGEVVVDTGFSLEEDPGRDFGSRPPRNGLTMEALLVADEILVVGAADPVGLARLARGLVDLREVVPGTPVRVVVNRMRPTLGWSEREVSAMIAGFARVEALHFLPDDRAGVDRALVTGQTLYESGDGPLARAVAGVVDELTGLPTDVPGRSRRPARRRDRRRSA